MNNYKIISDSACDLPEYIKKNLNIDIVPYYVTFDSVNYYKELEDIKVDEFYNKIESENLFPKTSLPTVQDYINTFEKYLKKETDVVCMCLSQKFSGSFQSAINAKNILLETYPNRRIEIIDTILATGAQGLLVYEAAKMCYNKMPLDTMIKKIENLKETAKINFTVDSLDYLQRGGRIGKVSALAGTILNIKPIIILQNGELIPVKKIRGTKKAIKTIIDMTLEEILNNKDKYKICILTAQRYNEAIEIKNILQNEYKFDVIDEIFRIGATIGTHTGPSAIGICYIKK